MNEEEVSENRKRYLERRLKNSESPPPLKRAKIEEKDNMGPYIVILVILFFVSSFYIFLNFPIIDLGLLSLFQLYCLFAAISFMIPIKLYRKKLTLSYYEYIIFNIISIAPLLISLSFFANKNFNGDAYVETYKIESYVSDETSITYTLPNNSYDDKMYLRSIRKGDAVEIMGNEYLSIYFSDGYFGIRIIEKKVLH